MALSDAWLKAAHRKPRDAVAERADRDGLGARVTKTGKVVFQLRYRYQGRAARMDLGTYPSMTLKEAREEAVKRRGQLEQGHDPRVRKRLEQQEIATAHTNESLIREWHKRYSQQEKANAGEILRSFELHVFPEIGDLPAAATGLARWMDLLEALAEQRPSIAERILTSTKQCHAWAARRELIQDQPLAAITAARDLRVRRGTRGRALAPEELRLAWQAMAASGMAHRSRLFVALCLIYGCRPGELRLARRSEFDLESGVWTIPPERHKTGKKTGRPLVRPVIQEVLPMLEEAAALSRSPTLLFSADRSAAPMNDRGVLSFPRSIRRAALNKLGKQMAPWAMYDLRKTARTNWSRLAEPHVCEVMLGHALPGVWQIYDHHHYLEEQEKAYQAWWEELTAQLQRPPRP
ncbi:MAG: tyrosine-type recombinase/integrase [Halomonas sp.]